MSTAMIIPNKGGGTQKTASLDRRDGKGKWVLGEARVLLDVLEKNGQLLFRCLHPKPQYQP